MSSASSNSSLYAGSSAEIEAQDGPAASEHLVASLCDAMSSEKLDRCIALQSQTSGLIHARTMALTTLRATAKDEIVNLKRDFADGAKIAKQLKADLEELQARIRACQELAKKKIPVEWHNVRDDMAQDTDEEE